MGWALFPASSKASVQDDLASARATVQRLESQLTSAQSQLNIDTQTVISDSNTVISAKIELDSATAAYQASAVTETITTGAAIHVDVYNQAYHRSRPDGVFCRQDTYTVIANNWGNGSVAGCNGDYVLIHYYGTITVPTTDTYRFKNIADDGFYMTLNNQVVIDEWRDKGCNGNWGTAITLQAGIAYPFDAWFYEWAGGACSTLYYQSSTNWSQVPSSWYGTTTVTTTYNQSLYAIVQQKQSAYNSALFTYNASVAKVNDDYTLISQINSSLQTARSTLAAIPYLNPPTNLQVNVDTSTASVHLTWSAPETSNASVLTYAISWSTSNFTTDGWGWTHDQTNVDIPFDIFKNSSGWNKNIQFRIRADNNTLMVYSDNSSSVEAFIPDPTTPSIPIQIPDTNTVVETHTVMETQTATETQTVSETSTTVVDTSTLQTPIDSQTVQETVTATTPVDPQPIVPTTPPSDPSPPVPPTPQPPIEVNPRPVPTQPVVDPVPPAPTPSPVEETPEPNPEPDPIPVPDIPQDPVDPQVNQDNNDPNQPSDSIDAPTEEPTPVEPDSQTPTDSQDSQTSDTVNQPVVKPVQNDDPSTNDTNNKQDLQPSSDPNNLPTDKPLLPPAEKLVPRVQVDIAGVTNGGIEFFGTKSQPQVIGEDGKLTPPPPPPGSGLPIPPEAITTTETFIGQPGGTTFNAPDIAVPVLPSYICKDITKEDGTVVHIDIDGNEHPVEQCTYLPAALDIIPGAGQAVQAIGQAYAALANIGNDMSPITRKKAKKILITTVIVGQIAGLRRRFGE